MSFRSEAVGFHKNNDEDTTVEGILESIRGVMSQEDDYDFSDVDDDILDLTDMVEDNGFKSSGFKKDAAENSVLEVIDDVFNDQRINNEEVFNDNISSKTVARSDSLIEDKVITESSNILKTLIEIIPSAKVNNSFTPGGITLEQLTIEAIKPLLAEWLNKNLPELVKQVVKEEIKKIVPESNK